MFRLVKFSSRSYHILRVTKELICIERCSKKLLYSNRILCRWKTGKTVDNGLSSLFTPVPVKSNPDDINVGEELSGQLDKSELIKILNSFYKRKEVKVLAAEQGLDDYLLHQAYINFRKYCLEVQNLPVDLHIAFSDILQGAGNVNDIFPYFLRFAREMFPHLECMDDLKVISDLRLPANWYPDARAIKRKIIFHAGPTNSGKTYHALERFLNSKSGIYCGPLKLLAAEVFTKSNSKGTPCDLVTGEERKYAISEDEPASHVSCTVEMTGLANHYEVAVIDEIQMIKDPARGWAWTRALLGLVADEIHLCGEEGAIQVIKNIVETTNEDVEICRYNRLTELHIEDEALCTLDKVEKGDCIVCFNKNDLYSVSREIESKGKEVAVIYGGLPPNTKSVQAQKFNDPDSSCNVLVATDAIGMGLNLSIRRVIFYSLLKITANEKGEKSMEIISVSQALQIAGRAGRYCSQYEKGYVTVFKPKDLKLLKNLLSQKPESITQAGIHPTAEQIELYAYHLPHSTLSNLMNIFVSLCTVDDSLYFMCNTEDFKFLAEMIQHIPLPLRARYIFCCAPLNKKMPFVGTIFVKYVRQYSKNESITADWIFDNIGWPLSFPKTILELVHLEAVFDALDIYLWLSYRFPDIFVDALQVRNIQVELDSLIQQGVQQITRLIKNSDKLSKVSERVSIFYEDENYESESNETKSHGGGSLTDRLVAEGLLTHDLLEELKNEWALGNRSGKTDSTYDRNDKYSNKPPRRIIKNKRKPKKK